MRVCGRDVQILASGNKVLSIYRPKIVKNGELCLRSVSDYYLRRVFIWHGDLRLVKSASVRVGIVRFKRLIDCSNMQLVS